MENMPVYYLDWKKVNKLKEKERDEVRSLYRDLLCYMSDDKIGPVKSIYHTLSKAGLLKDADIENRDEKINKIIE